ncbi:unnamed protein product [Trichobilharzia szidati]|nr:unnamed protein product [Trichobilharzia szidati]
MRDVESENKHNLWASLLDEVQFNRRNAYGTIESPDKPQIIILGSESVGKTRLVECINKEKEITCAIGLDYHFLDLSEDGKEDSLNMGIWCLDSNPQQTSSLLRFALNKSNIWHTMGIICVSYAEPWSILKELELWLQILEKHIEHLKIDAEEIENLKASIAYNFKKFIDPTTTKDEATKSAVVGLHHQISLQTTTVLKDHYENTRWSYGPLHPKPIDRGDGIGEPFSQSQLQRQQQQSIDYQQDKTGEEGKKNEDMEGSFEKQEEESQHRHQSNQWLKNVIKPGVMDRLLAIPIMIVITKSDMADALEKDSGYTDEQFDFILFHLRKLCLEYGAALIYTSVKESINTDVFLDYLKHRLFDMPLKNSAMLVDPEAIFIPAGWDSLHRLELFKKSLSPNLIDSSYNQVIPRPLKLRRKGSCASKATESTASSEEVNIIQPVEDDQHFLNRMLTMIANMPAPTATSSLGATTPGGSVTSAGQSRESSSIGEGIQSSLPSQSKPGSAAASSDKEAVLSSFFNSLLARKSLTEAPILPKAIQPTTANKPNPSSKENES